MTPHERPIPGPAADFGARLAALVPVIETERTRLRAPRLADFDAYAAILCGPVTEWLGGPFTRDAAFTDFEAGCGRWLLRGHGLWTVEDRAGTRLGFILIGFEPGDLEPELGYLFLPEVEGRGLAAEAARAGLAHARALRLPSLVSYIAPENHRSRALAQRLGARRDGAVQGAEVWRHDLQGDRP